MIVNGIDIVGPYKYVKFYRDSTVSYRIDGEDLHLYGTTSSDFAHLFTVVDSSVTIADSEFINLSPGKISRIGSLAIQPNTVNDVLLNLVIVSDSETKAVVNGNSVVILVKQDDIETLDLASLSSSIRLLLLAKDPGTKVSNIRNRVIRRFDPITDKYEDYTVSSVKNPNITGINFTNYLNNLNKHILELLPDFDMYINRKNYDKTKPNTILCDYNDITIDHHKFLSAKTRRHMRHDLIVKYEFRIGSDDIRYFKLAYEMTNYDFITNICELKIKDNNGITWTYAIHWEIEDPTLELNDVSGGNDNVMKIIRTSARINFITRIDPYLYGIIKLINPYLNGEPMDKITG